MRILCPSSCCLRKRQRIPRISAVGVAVLLALVGVLPASAQLRLGMWDVQLVGSVEFAYDSNVDDVYPEEEKEGYQPGDFYWMPGISISSSATGLRPSTSLSLNGEISYEDYFERSDLDTELYNLQLDFQTLAPRANLGGYAKAQYDVEGNEDEYRPGGSSRDPYSTYEGNLFLNLNWNKLRFESSVTYTRERHDYDEYQLDDQDETDVLAALYLDIFTWGSIYYSYEWDQTIYALDDREELEKTAEFGLDGSIPLSWLRHPQITFQLGIKSEEKNEDEEGASWEPNITITATDDLQMTKNLRLAGTLTWENDEYEDEVGTTFDISLEHQITTYLSQSISASLEPLSTFGSNADTETYTYTYFIGMKDLLIPHLVMSFTAEYKEETPLDSDDELTEDTTTLTYLVAHARPLTRRLDRTLSYEYSWEKSNFHHDGAQIKHLIIYGLSYRF